MIKERQLSLPGESYFRDWLYFRFSTKIRISFLKNNYSFKKSKDSLLAYLPELTDRIIR